MSADRSPAADEVIERSSKAGRVPAAVAPLKTGFASVDQLRPMSNWSEVVLVRAGQTQPFREEGSPTMSLVVDSYPFPNIMWSMFCDEATA